MAALPDGWQERGVGSLLPNQEVSKHRAQCETYFLTTPGPCPERGCLGGVEGSGLALLLGQ